MTILKKQRKKRNQFARNRWECDYGFESKRIIKICTKRSCQMSPNFEERTKKYAGNRIGLRANQIKSLN